MLISPNLAAFSFLCDIEHDAQRFEGEGVPLGAGFIQRNPEPDGDSAHGGNSLRPVSQRNGAFQDVL